MEFDYTVKTNQQRENEKIDWEMLQYSGVYKTLDFYANRFPNGYDNLPGIEKILEKMVTTNENKTPLSEYNKITCNTNDN